MATFVRQLNNYGFKKSAKDSSKLEFENEFFIRSQPQNYWKIRNRRKRNKAKAQASANVDATSVLLNLRTASSKRQRRGDSSNNVQNSKDGDDGDEDDDSNGNLSLLQQQAHAAYISHANRPSNEVVGSLLGAFDNGQLFRSNRSPSELFSQEFNLNYFLQQAVLPNTTNQYVNGANVVGHSMNNNSIVNSLQTGQKEKDPHNDDDNNNNSNNHQTRLDPAVPRMNHDETIKTASKIIHLLEDMDFTKDSNTLREEINHKLVDFASPSTETVMNSVAHVAREMAQMKIGLVNFLDKSKQVMHGNSGLEYMNSCDFETAICKTTIRDDTPNVYIIPDCTKDPTVKDNPLVTEYPHVRFYAGVPVTYTDKKTRRKVKLGAVCVLDDKPREIDGCVKNCLLWLAKLVGDVVETKLSYTETIRTGNGGFREVIQKHQNPVAMNSKPSSSSTMSRSSSINTNIAAKNGATD